MPFSHLTTHIQPRGRGTRTAAVAVAAMALALVATLLPAAADVNEVPTSGNQTLAGNMTLGDSHGCVVFGNGNVKCWGGNDTGQLGVGDTNNRGDNPGEMGDALPFVDLGAGRTAVQISAGDEHTCAIRDDGSVVCWGGNVLGKLGIGAAPTIVIGDQSGEMGDALTAVPLPAAATAISAGRNHNCAIVTGGDLYCWGTNGFGQLGQGNKESIGDAPGEVAGLSPVALGTGRTAIAVTTGDSHTCVLLDDNTVKCMGNGGSGRLGSGASAEVGTIPAHMGDALPIVDLGAGRTALAVSAGQDHTCVLRDTGDVVCFGANGFGQLGQGSTDSWGFDPGHVGAGLIAVPLGTGRTAVAISTQANTTCAQLDNGTAKCWGSNLGAGPLGQLRTDSDHAGDAPGELGDALPPIDVGGNGTIQFITTGNGSTCAVVASGDVKCWGDGDLGVNGQGNTLDWGVNGAMGDFLPVIDFGGAVPPTTTTLPGSSTTTTGGGGGTTTTTTGGGGGTTTTTTGGGGGGGGGTTTTTIAPTTTLAGGPGGATTTTVPSLAIAVCDTSGAGNDFTDIAGSYAEADINCLNDIGVINGFTSELFGLRSVLTREQGVAMIARLYRDVLDLPCDSSSHPFTDIPAGHFVSREAACLNDTGLVNGTSAVTFGLGQPLSREQMAAILGRFWLSLSRGCPSLEHPFTDLAVGGYAEPFIACLSNLADPAGGTIINGRTATTYDPFATITREEMAALLGRIYRAYLDAVY